MGGIGEGMWIDMLRRTGRAGAVGDQEALGSRRSRPLVVINVGVATAVAVFLNGHQPPAVSGFVDYAASVTQVKRVAAALGRQLAAAVAAAAAAAAAGGAAAAVRSAVAAATRPVIVIGGAIVSVS